MTAYTTEELQALLKAKAIEEAKQKAELPKMTETEIQLAKQIETLKNQLHHQKPATIKERTDTVSKKTAAVEVHTHLRTIEIFGLVAIVGGFLIIAAGFFNAMAAIIVLLIIAVFVALKLKKNTERKKYIEATYDLQPKKKQF